MRNIVTDDSLAVLCDPSSNSLARTEFEFNDTRPTLGLGEDQFPALFIEKANATRRRCEQTIHAPKNQRQHFLRIYVTHE